MQRWIVAGILAVVLVIGGGLYGYKAYKMSRPHPIWLALPIRVDLEKEKRDQIIDSLKTKLSEPELLEKVSKELGLPAKMELPNDDACVKEMQERLFIRTGDADTPMGKIPALHIGMKGTNRNRETTGEIVNRIRPEVFEILGIDPPPNP